MKSKAEEAKLKGKRYKNSFQLIRKEFTINDSLTILRIHLNSFTKIPPDFNELYMMYRFVFYLASLKIRDTKTRKPCADPSIRVYMQKRIN